ncbi:putative metal-dependent HD superfamily phosphohydrolase [Spirosoma lacussanchae]|uniref:Pycsar system effector family protein n=1 Tax=Spirosoma lacussanchae TaxID=1884249 RepID=UPI001109428C|nr:Pycsar system effector family protein [Spirosoma lacussanchae]
MQAINLHHLTTYVHRFFQEHPRPELVYHNLDHTKAVVKAVDELAQHASLTESDYQAVMAAAWFHDLGYLTGPPEQHETASADLAAAYLREAGADADFIDRVQRCILATQMPQSPQTLPEEILCDADLYHLGSDAYKDRQKRLRKELEQLSGQPISGSDWRQQNITLLEQHRYFTPYAQRHLQKGQAENLERMRDKQAEKAAISPASAVTEAQPEPAAPASEPEKGRKKDKENRPDRGIETMFRTTSTNHLRLSEIADSKANIMISVNSIMVSVLVSVLPRRIEENPSLMVPTALFLTTAILTIIFAILATRPNVTQGTFSHEDIQQRKGNLLFFGNFHQMSLSEYEWGISELMRDSTYLYSSMTRDIYYLGRVLGKKYKLLRVAYNIFMFGFVVSVLAFLGVFFYSGK